MITLLERLTQLNEIGIALSKERDLNELLRQILIAVKRFTEADGGTLYLVTDAQELHFEFALTDSLGLCLGATDMPKNIPLFLPDKRPNKYAVAAYAALNEKVLNFEDVYSEQGFDFSGPRHFDEAWGYRTKSLLTLPLKNHEGVVIGVLQLINSRDPESGKIVSFSLEMERLALSLASQAAIALTNRGLIVEQQRLFEALIELIAVAVDTKSPAMGNHGRRVPILTEMLARALNETHTGPLQSVRLSEDEIYELRVAAYLHDCGKITTPEYLIDKHTKLETVFDRIKLIETRIALLTTELQCALWQAKWNLLAQRAPDALKAIASECSELDRVYADKEQQLQQDLLFMHRCNQGQEPITPTAQEHLQQIAKMSVVVNGQTMPLLSDEERETLGIVYGNLTAEERAKVENHVVLTESLLRMLSFPKKLARVPEIAGAHHERFDGKGYPRGLAGREIPIGARILAIADIFEALSAPDRAYKTPLPLSKAFEIMKEKVASGHIDPDLYDIFVTQEVGERYAESYLSKEQNDLVPLS